MADEKERKAAKEPAAEAPEESSSSDEKYPIAQIKEGGLTDAPSYMVAVAIGYEYPDEEELTVEQVEAAVDKLRSHQVEEV